MRWSRYNPYYLEPEVRKEVYDKPETELSDEEKEEQSLKALRPIKAATNSVTSSVFHDPVIRYLEHILECFNNQRWQNYSYSILK